MTDIKRTMTKDEHYIMLMIKDAKESQINTLFDKLCENGGWVLKAIKKRFECYNLVIDKKIMIMILTIGDGVIGKCVPFVDAMYQWEDHEHDFDSFIKKVYGICTIKNRLSCHVWNTLEGGCSKCEFFRQL